MFDFISKLFPHGTTAPKDIPMKNPSIKYGITTSIRFWIKGLFGEVTETRRNAFLGNSASLLSKYDGITYCERGLFDGLASGIFGTGSEPDRGLVDSTVVKLHFHKQELLRNREIILNNIDHVNLTGVIYNMLRLYYIKLYGHVLYHPDHAYYDDGHVKVTNYQAFGDFAETTLGSAVTFDEGNVNPRLSRRDFSAAENAVYYDLGSSISGTMAKVLKLAHCGWKALAPFGVAHTSERLTSDYTLVNSSVNGRLPDWLDITADNVFACIGDFVRKNGAYRDFEIAYGMLCSVLTRPVPRSAESVVWNTSTPLVHIPKPVCLRGIAAELYMGQIYMRTPDWQNAYHSWFNSPGAAVPHSVAFGEAIYTELFHLTRLKRHSAVDRENFMAMATGIESCPQTGIMLDTALTCMRYGREHDFAYFTVAGVDRLATIPDLLVASLTVTLSDKDAALSYDLGDMTGLEAPLNISAFAPVAYPSLSYGINEDGYYNNADKLEVKTVVSDLDGSMVLLARLSSLHSCRLCGYMDMTSWPLVHSTVG
jgi:hypothetical protein